MTALEQDARWAVKHYSDGVTRWNPFNLVVQDHKDGRIFDDITNHIRKLLCLPTPWTVANTAGHKPVELTLENIRKANSPYRLPRSPHLHCENYHYSDTWRALGIMSGCEDFCECDNALFACAMLESYARLNARLEAARTEARQVVLMGVDHAQNYGTTICHTVIGIVPEGKRRMIPVLIKRESDFLAAMRQNYSAMNARHSAEYEIGRQRLAEYTALVGACLEEKIWRDVVNKLSLTSLWRE